MRASLSSRPAWGDGIGEEGEGGEEGRLQEDMQE